MDINDLKAEIVRNGMQMGEFAKAVGITTPTLARRLNNPNGFSLEELTRIIKILKLDNEKAMDIFFKKKVSQKTQIKEE